ncbi:Glycoside hydrolase family 28 protein [Mycena venus]|uniref:endo-polygalacturonase n=1 Tax=Mycena venus TaxID=2733690 RepID=A0A8H6XV75_9AGAR|nr:Glycoside hydrolase family 28 protein [Mycena venus]
MYKGPRKPGSLFPSPRFSSQAMPSLTTFVRLAALVAAAVALPNNGTASKTETAKRATCTVNSVASAADLSDCTAVVITAFTVPSGDTITIAAASGATVTMTGDITFAKTTAAGPLITFDTDNIVFNGGDHNINVSLLLQPSWWLLVFHLHLQHRETDPFTGMAKACRIISVKSHLLTYAKGTNGGVAKPHPFVKFKGFGTFEDVTVLNSPAQAISVGTTGGAAIIQGVTVDNSAGDAGALGHNTDGFDISASSVTVSKCTVKNQDDCVAINSGSTIVIEDSTCSGGHGISIGSIATGKTVSGVTIARNTVIGGASGLYGLRIKVDADATDASVSNVKYEGNTVSGITEYGVLISQSYPDDDGTPGTGAPISGISFTGGTTSVSVESKAHTLVVDCGACSGTWDFSDLVATGGVGHIIAANKATISGGTY